MEKTSNHYVLILCGGTGPRLWPLSRASRPKQFLKLFDNKTLIENTYQRFINVVPKQNIFFVSNQKYLTQLKDIFGHSVPDKNFISEPSKKNTTTAILLGTAVIQKINPEAVITATPADHFISKLDSFHHNIQLSYSLANKTDKIVTIGIQPTSPNPAYGYIIPSSKISDYFPVLRFIEKPTIVDANLYIKKDAFWNSGIYTFSIPTLINQLIKLQPQYYSLFQKLSQKTKNIKTAYQTSPALPFDKAVSEKSDSLIMIPAKFVWSDIGEWQSIWQQLTKNRQGMATINSQTKFVSQDSQNCLISSSDKKLVGLVGLNNLAIIDTPDSLLVCNLNDSYSVRDLITKIVADTKLKNYFLKNNDQ